MTAYQNHLVEVLAIVRLVGFDVNAERSIQPPFIVLPLGLEPSQDVWVQVDSDRDKQARGAECGPGEKALVQRWNVRRVNSLVG
jgi:hypothetical protein